MKTKLEHIFITKSHSLMNLFKDTHLLSTFMRKLEKDALLDPNRYDPMKYVGDGFEFFVELFLLLHPSDNRIGIYDYRPVQENDNGVDGVGTNILEDKCVVQVKYRSNTQSFLTTNQDHLSNLITDGMGQHGVVYDQENVKNYRHFVITTAKGLHFYTDTEMFKSRVKCIGYNDLRNMIDSNYSFWNQAKEIVEQYNK